MCPTHSKMYPVARAIEKVDLKLLLKKQSQKTAIGNFLQLSHLLRGISVSFDWQFMKIRKLTFTSFFRT